jgi:hypothetical protein
LICHLTEATKSTTVYPAFAMSGMRTSTLWWLLTRISCHLGILLGGYRYAQHYIFTFVDVVVLNLKCFQSYIHHFFNTCCSSIV